MKEKGFTLIEVMVVMAIIGILLSVVLGAINEHRAEQPIEETAVVEDAPMQYIDNDRRASETVTLKRHSDGSLWACKENADCNEVK